MIAVEMHGRQTAFVGGFSGVISRRQCRSRVRMCSAAPLVPKLSLVTCDVDGTLLNSSHSVHPNVADAVRESLDQGIKFFCATGKSRQGALNSIGDLGNAIRNIYDGNMPGVYLQGLIVYGLDGNIVYEKTMSEELCWKMINKSREIGMTLVGYNGDRILCEKHDSETDKLAPYKEPRPEEIGKWENVVGKVPLHKFLFLAPVEEVKLFRPILDEIVQQEATITQAMEDMIEVLPPNASKGDGVKRLLESFGGSFDDLLALGDAENDVEMLRFAKVGVAMGNGTHKAKKVADVIVSTNDNHGVAEALHRFILNPEPVVLSSIAGA